MKVKERSGVIDRHPIKQLPQYGHALAKQRHPLVHGDAQALVFLGATAQRDAQREPPATQMMQGRDLPGDNRCQAQVEHQHGRTEQQVSRVGRGPGEQH